MANLTTLGFRTFGLAVADNYGKDTIGMVEAELASNSARLVSRATLEGFVAAKAMIQLLRRSRDLSRASIQQAIAEGGRLELNIAKGARASKFVEIAVVGPEGRLIR